MGLTTSRDNSQFETFVEQLPDLHGKTIAITTGLGYVFAETCVKKNAAAVLLLNRPSDRAQSAEKKLKEIARPTTTVETIECDLQDFASVRKAAAHIKENYDAVDILCNNAGIMAVSDEATVDGYDVQMQTNYLSHFLLTKELMPLLQKASELREEARIVNQLSFMRLSKLAHSVFACALRDRLKGTGIKVANGAPGYAATNLTSTTPGFTGLRWSRALAQPVDIGCMPLLSAAFLTSSDIGIWEPGRFRMYGAPVEFELEETSTKKEFQNILWEASEEACGKFDL